MLTPRIKAALVVLAASAGLSACTSYGPYGGSGVGVGVSYGGNPYGYGYGSPYGYGYGNPYYAGYGRYPYFGWYDGYYYPGAGYWVYDPHGGRHRITRSQSEFWRNMVRKYREEQGTNAVVKENFAAFRERARSGATIRGVNLDAQANAQADQRSVREINQARREAQIERQQARAERAQASEVRSERQQRMIERRETRRSRRGGGE